MSAPQQIQEIELQLLLAGIAQVYGYDFREYAGAPTCRRMTQWLSCSPFSSYGEALPRLLREPHLFETLLRTVTVHVSEMFRDPPVFKAIREQVVPHLKTYPFCKIWVAGCSGGEEAYSLAILLEEEGVKRFRIYATDIDPEVLRKAKAGVFPMKEIQRFAGNYQAAGGRNCFSEYYASAYEHALLRESLRERVVFSRHNLAVDGVFGEMQMVLCRNVLIYFQQPLKERVLRLLDTSIAPGGFLCLGTKETLAGTEDAFGEFIPHSRIYRKLYA